MITNHDVRKRITVSGETADLYLSVGAVGINSVDANQAEVAFDKFISTITGSTPEKHSPAHGTPTNFCKGKWSDAEKAAVLSVPEEEAWQNYHRLFPNSPRTKNAVWRRREELLLEPIPVKTHAAAGGLSVETPPIPKQKEVVPVAEKKPRETNQYGIPKELFGADKKQYQRLWARCKSQGINYTEALAQEGVIKRGNRPGKKVVTTLSEVKQTPIKKERLPFHQTQPDGAASSGTNSQIIVRNRDSSAPATAVHQKIKDVIVKQNGPLRAGQQVKHNGSKASPFFGKVGTIQKLSNDGDVYIKFGESLTWLTPTSIVVVPGVEA